MLRLHEQYIVDISLSSERKLGKGRGLQAVVATGQRGSFQPFGEDIGDKCKYGKAQILASRVSGFSHNLEAMSEDLLYVGGPTLQTSMLKIDVVLH